MNSQTLSSSSSQKGTPMNDVNVASMVDKTPSVKGGTGEGAEMLKSPTLILRLGHVVDSAFRAVADVPNGLFRKASNARSSMKHHHHQRRETSTPGAYLANQDKMVTPISRSSSSTTVVIEDESDFNFPGGRRTLDVIHMNHHDDDVSTMADSVMSKWSGDDSVETQKKRTFVYTIVEATT